MLFRYLVISIDAQSITNSNPVDLCRFPKWIFQQIWWHNRLLAPENADTTRIRQEHHR